MKEIIEKAVEKLREYERGWEDFKRRHGHLKGIHEYERKWGEMKRAYELAVGAVEKGGLAEAGRLQKELADRESTWESAPSVMGFRLALLNILEEAEKKGSKIGRAPAGKM